MWPTPRYRLCLPVILSVTIGCHSFEIVGEPGAARMDRAKAGYGTYFTHMADNALLRDMSVADIHFVPHTSELNGLGAARLERLASFLNVYGGTVRYEAHVADETLVEQRLGHIREYLELAGCDLDRVRVLTMRSGGRGLPGDEAVRAYRHGTAQDAENDSEPASAMGAAPSGQAGDPPKR